MSNSNSGSASGGLGFASLLTVLFIGLKLTHYIDWSWWWVLSPMWIGLAFAAFCFTMFLLVAALVAFIKG
jgi:hypothetical protein